MIYSLLLWLIQGKTLSLQQKNLEKLHKIRQNTLEKLHKWGLITLEKLHLYDIFLTGARQSGKTYAIRKYAKNNGLCYGGQPSEWTMTSRVNEYYK